LWRRSLRCSMTSLRHSIRISSSPSNAGKLRT
jgi:hypothetical protein